MVVKKGRLWRLCWTQFQIHVERKNVTKALFEPLWKHEVLYGDCVADDFSLKRLKRQPSTTKGENVGGKMESFLPSSDQTEET